MKSIIVGDSFVITSEFTLEQLKTVEKYRPSALQLKGGEDGKQTVYTVMTSNKPGDINNIGAIFGSEAHDGSGKATITINVDRFPGEDKREAITDAIGKGLASLKKIEENLAAVIEEISAEKAAVRESITLG